MARRKARREVFERTPKGYIVNLQREEIDLVVRLVAELRGLLLADDPNTAAITRRLFPPAYHLVDDAVADAEYQRLMREELVASRLAAMQQVDEVLTSKEPLTEEAMHGLLQSLNAVRLVLGTLLDVSEAHDPDDVGDDDPMVGEHYLYQFLSYLLEVAVQAVSQ
ncbi:MAG: DUF2017 domain-containing protein [Ilumatobacteraceae bacterium]|nr:DUF2017 domain-containing protein [Ilumatobacteraceae bacterium]